MCIINTAKWNELRNRNVLFELQKHYPTLRIVEVKIHDPDNPAKLNDAKLIAYEF